MTDHSSEEDLLGRIEALSKELGDDPTAFSSKSQRLHLAAQNSDWAYFDEFLNASSQEERSINYQLAGYHLGAAASQSIENGAELEALVPLEKAVEIFHEVTATEGLFGLELWAITQTADILKKNNREPEALILYQKAEQICRQNKVKPPAYYHSVWSQALIHGSNHRYEDAIEVCRRIEIECLEAGDKEGLAEILGKIAYFRLNMDQTNTSKDWKEILAILKRQESICREIGHKNGLYSSLRNQVWPLRELGKMEDTMKALFVSMDYAREIGDFAYYKDQAPLFVIRLLQECKGNKRLARKIADFAKAAAVERNLDKLAEKISQT